jgi:regulator of sigma D
MLNLKTFKFAPVLILVLIFHGYFNHILGAEKITIKLESEIESAPPKFEILILGGGYSPSGNQVSLESNIRYFRRIQKQTGLIDIKTKTLFADGVNVNRDLQFYDPEFIIPEVNLILAEIFGSTRGLYNQYRNNNLNADGPASTGEIKTWLHEINATNSSNINLIYFTGHGGKGDKKNPINTTAYLWNNSKLKVSDLSKELDNLSPNKVSILVMVQCYSGGFANIIFKDGNPEKGLSEQIRAGFFSTVHDRVAAGCTPDIREENYREYSTRFWEALSGETRTGSKVSRPDYNHDGKTSLSEAHAYVIINSKTIDIPVKTTDVFIRKFSKSELSNENNSTTAIQQKSLDLNNPKKIKPNSINRNSPLKKILSLASPESRAIIVKLSEILNLTKTDRYSETETKYKKLKEKRDQVSKDKKKLSEDKKSLKYKIRDQIKQEWPEISNINHPIITNFYSSDQAKKIIDIANNNQNWQKLKKLTKEIQEIEQERFNLEKQQVLLMRLQREFDNILLTNDFMHNAEPELIKRFKELSELESLTPIKRN